MALDDRRDLGRMDKHALDLGRLIRTPHPSLDAQIRAPARRNARKDGGQIAGAESNQRVVDILEERDDDFPHVAGCDRIPSAGLYDFDQHAFIDNESFARDRFVRDRADVGGRIDLIAFDATIGQPFAQTRRKRFRRHERFAQTR